ncbi:U3 small nucleolar RNA-associated protein 18 homolog [Bicyclus anynana]|uniref:U3 small nucleolar RNA-associated protein 18 homolog n=1 Tax=Bicyclus anynana TaxID=110368 RepID=A0A6J1NYQ7_BICAN|nr:U3 small nucleolar RNA-associated protein 18 homolog [Bicyclus anynana]
MKRKNTSLDEEENRVSSLLFNKSKKFTENISSQENEIDVDIKPAWVDEDDHQLAADIITKVKSDGLYTQKLKQKYEVLVGTPKWAKITNQKDDSNKLTKTVGHLKKTKSRGLKKGILEIHNFPRINSKSRNEGRLITAVEFHPKLSVALVAGQSGVVSLFSIGGEDKNKLHSFQLNRWRVSAAQFDPDGTEAFITSKTSHDYYVYNLVKAEAKAVQLPQAIKRATSFRLSPNGKLLAASDTFSEIYIICAKSKELLKVLKTSTNIESLAFDHNSEKLYSYGISGEVTIWDLSTYRAINKFVDNGCVTASCMDISACGQLLATGSAEGIVNVYETQKLTTRDPLPLKVISNLTTKITNLKFNPTTEILCASSSFYPNAIKLVHIPSYHVFSNFPQRNVQQVETTSFSPNSGYMALGNNTGAAYLYRLKHYKNY